jgi:acetolactate synthase I/II/III large subunit
MMKPFTKYCKTIVNGDVMPSMVRQAFKLSLEERPGSVLLELPEDIAKEETNAHIFSIHPKERPIASDRVIDTGGS